MSRSSPNNPRPRPRTAFTLLELLVVMGIMVLLIAMAGMLWRAVGGSKNKATHVVLQGATGMLTNLEVAAGLGGLPTGEVDATAMDLEPTRQAMDRMRSIPDNRQILAQLPASAVKASGTAVVLLDAWDNPLLLVPAEGLRNVRGSGSTWSASTAYKTGQRVAYNGLIYTCIRPGSGDPPTDTSRWYPGVRSPSGRPFFASAGADGNLAGGDDNLYSFEN